MYVSITKRLNYRYGSNCDCKHILHEMATHEEKDCNICYLEEAKSIGLKLNKTKILQKEIIPYNVCWNCNLTFQDGYAQVQHFLDEHECQFCDGSYVHVNPWYFDDLDSKKKHISENHAICSQCGEAFKNYWDKRNHYNEKHKDEKRANSVFTKLRIKVQSVTARMSI